MLPQHRHLIPQPPPPPPPYYSALRSNVIQHPNQNHHHQQQQIYPNISSNFRMSNNGITSTATPPGPGPVHVPIPSSSPPSASSTAAVVVPNTVVPFPVHLPGEIQGSNGQATSFRLQYPSNLQFHRYVHFIIDRGFLFYVPKEFSRCHIVKILLFIQKLKLLTTVNYICP